MDEHDHSRIATHFEECVPCLQEYGIYQEVKLLVKRSCACEPVPEHVRALVVARIRSVTVAIESVSLTIETRET
jgi:mycothiol system anti-sigma-R factor